MTPAVETAFAAALLDELTTVVSALLGVEPAASDAEPPAAPVWIAAIEAEGVPGACSVAVADGAARALTAQITGIEEVSPESVIDTLRELYAQAAAAAGAKPVAHGARLTVGTIALHEDAVAAAAVSRALALPPIEAPVTFAAWGQPAFPAAARGALVVAGDTAAPAAGRVPPERIDVILDIELPLVVRFGHTELPLKTLMRLGPGSVIDLGRSPDDPVEVLVSNQVVARGEVVIVGGNYGIRILDVVSPGERIRSVER